MEDILARPNLNSINSTTGLVPVQYLLSQAPTAAFNEAGVANLIATKGFSGYHYMSAPNPDRNAFGAPPNPNTQASYSGRIYFDVRPLTIIPTQIKLEERLQVQGIYDVYSLVLNVSGQYTDTRPNSDNQVYLKHNDLIVPDFGITILAEQLLEYNPTGPQRLNFNTVGVQYLADNIYIYEQDTDFIVQNGMICWLDSGTKPKFADGKGAVLSCVYYTNPIFAVQALPHALRILPSNSAGSGALPREAVYAPQLVIVKNLTSANINPFDGSLLNAKQAPNLPAYPTGGNVTGGSN